MTVDELDISMFPYMCDECTPNRPCVLFAIGEISTPEYCPYDGSKLAKWQKWGGSV
jgi:hypothetical protein